MKKPDTLIKLSFAILLLVFAATGCKDTADLFIEPVEYEIPFTFTPPQGAPGTVVNIQGSDFTGVTQAAFGSVAAEITAQSGTSISAIVPVGALTSKIKLVKSGMVLTSRTEFVVEPATVPLVTGFTPAIAGSGELITITGLLLNEVDSVFIGDLKAEIEGTPTANELQVTAPDGLQAGRIRLFYTYLTSYNMLKPAESVSEASLSLALPVVASVEPDITSLDIGDEVVITGSLLENVTKVEFGNTEADPFHYADGTITCTVPAGATSGTIRLTTADGVVETSRFIVNLPAIELFLPQKGEEGAASAQRSFMIDGTNLGLVNEVHVGSATATILSRTETKILFTVPANSAGFITLDTDNGLVSSPVPFIFTGEFWVNDWETVFPVNRFSHFANNNLGSFAADESGPFARLTLGGNGNLNNSSFYLWGPDASDDKFSLFTPDPDGVYLEFDMRVIEMADSLKQDDNTLKFKIYTMDSKGWGASGEYSYGANGPTSYLPADGEWHHFSMHLKDFRSSDNSGLYTVDQVSGIAGAFLHPNSLRILTFIFGTPNESGRGNIVVGLDNVKFVIN